MQIQTTNQNLASCIETSIWTQKNAQKCQVCMVLVFLSGCKILSIGSFHSFLGAKHYKQQFQNECIFNFKWEIFSSKTYIS
jgi:phosphoheptose isomerase